MVTQLCGHGSLLSKEQESRVGRASNRTALLVLVCLNAMVWRTAGVNDLRKLP